MMKKFSPSSILRHAWLLIITMMMATSALSQSSDTATVLDTNGRPLQGGEVEYYIKPAITDSGGVFTLIDRNDSCPLYVGQLNTDAEEGIPVFFTPFATEDNVVRVQRDLKVTFAAATICVQSTEWKLGERDEVSGRRIIVAAGSNGERDYGNYFRIVETENEGIYNIVWCPTEVCPICRFDCGTVGGLRENGKILAALDGSVLPVVFERKA